MLKKKPREEVMTEEKKNFKIRIKKRKKQIPGIEEAPRPIAPPETAE